MTWYFGRASNRVRTGAQALRVLIIKLSTQHPSMASLAGTAASSRYADLTSLHACPSQWLSPEQVAYRAYLFLKAIPNQG